MSKIAVSGLSKIYVTKKDFSNILNIIFGFIVGLGSIFNFMNPFAIGYLCVFLGRDNRQFILIGTSIMLGLLINFNSYYTLSHIIGILILMFINKRLSTYNRGLIGAVVVAITSVPVIIFNTNFYFILAYTTLSLVTFFLPLLMERGVRVLSFENEGAINQKEIISLAIIFMAVLLGVDGVNLSFIYLNIYIIITFGLLLCNTNNYAISTTGILIMSFLPLVTNSISGSMVISLCISGLIASIPKNNNKYKVIFNYSLGLFISYFYIDNNIMDTTMIITVLWSYISFLMMPKYIFLKLQKSFNTRENTYIGHEERIKFYTSEKIKKYVGSFENLSKTYKYMNLENIKFSKEDVSRIIDNTVNDTCKSCERQNICWDKKFYSTYRISENMVENIKNGNFSMVEEEKKQLANICIYPEDFFQNLYRNFKYWEKERLWQNKIINNKRIIWEQFYDISNILRKIIEDLENKIEFLPTYENLIFHELERNDLRSSLVAVMKDENEHINIWLTLDINMKESEGLKSIERIINNIIGKRMSITKYIRLKDNTYEIFLEELNDFKVITGIGKVNKNNSSVSGDSYTAYKIGNSQVILAVSDGMGSGEKANFDSHLAIELFEDLIDTGFTMELALKFINSSLILKGDEERFTTLDGVCINLHDGIGEFVKMGASPSFIIRDNKVETIQSNSLPIGILNNAERESIIRKFKKGDVIVLVTDGVLEVIKDTKRQIEWMTDILWKNKNRAPAILSQIIIDEALNIADDENDDMTCIVGKIL